MRAYSLITSAATYVPRIIFALRLRLPSLKSSRSILILAPIHKRNVVTSWLPPVRLAGPMKSHKPFEGSLKITHERTNAVTIGAFLLDLCGMKFHPRKVDNHHLPIIHSQKVVQFCINVLDSVRR